MRPRRVRVGLQPLPVDVYLGRLPSSVRRNTYRLLEYFVRALDPALCPRTVPWNRLTASDYSRAAAAVASAQPVRIVNAVRNRVLAVLRQEHTSGRLLDEEYTSLKTLPWKPRPSAPESIRGDAVFLMLRRCHEDPSDRGARDGALIALIWCHAWTTSQVIRAQIADVNPGCCTSAMHMRALERWLGFRGGCGGPFLFGVTRTGASARRAISPWAVVESVKRRAESAGLGRITPELLRRSSILHAAGKLDALCADGVIVAR